MTARRWLLLVVLSLAAVIVLTSLHISAALLIGPMAAAVALASTGRSLRVPPPIFLAVQAVVGVMIARVFTPALFGEAVHRGPLFLAAVVSVLAAACLVGFTLTRWRVLPGTAALWGAFPGAATTMTLMAADFGATSASSPSCNIIAWCWSRWWRPPWRVSPCPLPPMRAASRPRWKR